MPAPATPDTTLGTKYRRNNGDWESVDGEDAMLLEALTVQHEMDFLCGSYDSQL